MSLHPFHLHVLNCLITVLCTNPSENVQMKCSIIFLDCSNPCTLLAGTFVSYVDSMSLMLNEQTRHVCRHI